MMFFYKVPPASIREYVKNILVINDSNITRPFTLPLFANGCPTLVFQNQQGILKKALAGHLTLFGQTISPCALTINGNFTLIAYFFKPHALVSLFNIAGSELSDSHAALNLLNQSGSRQLEEKLLHCTTADDMCCLLNSFIFNLITHKKSSASEIESATNLLENNSGFTDLKSVQNKLHVTEKTLQRMFESKVGLSPRMYKRIFQFNTAFEQVKKKNFLKLSDIAYENGYADQSHFIRTFKEFTKLTPGEYLAFGSART